MKLPHLESELRDNLSFKDFYQFTFNYAKNPCQKGLDLDMAITYWNIVMQGRFKFLNLWCRFLQVSFQRFIENRTCETIYRANFNIARSVLHSL